MAASLIVVAPIVLGFFLVQRQFIADYPAYLDWTINQDRLYLLAFVQDLDSGEILQGVVLKVPLASLPFISY